MSAGNEYPSVWVYVSVRGLDGQQNIYRYVLAGTDHAEAVKDATRSIRPIDILDVASFDGEPRRWTVANEVTEATS